MKQTIYISIILGLAVTAPAFGQSKLDMHSALLAEAAREESATRAAGEPAMVNVLLTLKEGSTLDLSAFQGVKVNCTVGNTVVADVPATILSLVLSHSDVKYGKVSEASEPNMYYARMAKNSNVNMAHSDPLRELGKPYLGKGVVCGIFDIGFDVNHVNFLDNEDRTKTRVKRLVYFESTSATATTDTQDPKRIAKFKTDAYDAHHGSHTLGIMAGGFRGMGQWKDFDYGADSVCHDLSPREPKFGSHDPSTEPVAYYGNAPKADIVLCGTKLGLYEGQQITSLKAAIDYAKSVEEPCVINHSFGSQWGPKDGSGSYGDLMNEFAKDAIICKSAGNEGAMDDYLSETLTEDRSSVATILDFINTDKNKGEVEYWISDNRDIEVELFFAGLFKVPGYTTRQWVEIPFKTYKPKGEVVDLEGEGFIFETLTPESLPEELKGAFEGQIKIGIGVAAQNNRYSIDIVFPAGYNNKYATYNDSKSAVQFGVRIKGQPGQRVDGNAPKDYCKFSNAYASKGEDYVGGSSVMSISEGSTCRNIISVGSYSARTTIKYLDGHTYYTNTKGKEGGNHHPSSAYGLTVDGRRLPQVCAPGVNIISSENRYYTEKDPSNVVARAEVDGETYDFIEMSGTSMSCPAFAGIVALWLEADPTLLYDDIIDILEHTCRHDEYTEAAPERFGYGKADAYEGLKYVLTRRNSAVCEVKDFSDLLIRETSRGIFEVTVPGGGEACVMLYSLDGTLVRQATGEDTVTVDTQGIDNAVTIFTVRGKDFVVSKKIKL